MLFNSDLVSASQKSIDGKMYKEVFGKHVPYDNAADVLAIIPNTRRHIGQLFRVANGATIEDWHFVGGIADGNLVKRNYGGGGGALPVGGTTGQVLAKNSNADGDAGWVTAAATGGLGFEPAATFAGISGTGARLVYVEADEENNDNHSLYLHTGTNLKFLQTVD